MGAPLKTEHKLLDALIKERGLANDAALARVLNMASPQISKIRNGKNPIGPDFILKVHEKFGIPVVIIRAMMG